MNQQDNSVPQIVDDDDIAEFDELVSKKVNKERRKIMLGNFTNMLITPKSMHVRKQETTDKNRRDGIGDAFLESVVDVNTPNNPIDPTVTQKLLGYRRDYVIIDIKDDVVSRYSVYAVTYGSDTRVLNVIYKKYIDLPIIHYYTTTIDPSMVIDNAYEYEVGRKRTVFLKRAKQYITNPMKDYITSLDLNETPRPDLLINDAIISDVPYDLIELSLIIRNQQYISMASYNDLIDTINYLLIF